MGASAERDSRIAPLWRALLAMQRFAWEQGVMSHAALDCGDHALVRVIVADAVARATADGQLGGMDDPGAVNSGALLEAALAVAAWKSAHAAASDGTQAVAAADAPVAQAAQRQRWWLLRFAPRDDWGVLHHLVGSTEVWADSVYMVVPALVAAGDLAPADMQYRMHREQLFDSSTGLYAHRHDMATGVTVRPEPWASGNGWIAAGLARGLHLGVEAVTVRERWEAETHALLDACAAYARPDGRFHDVLNDASTFVDGTAGLMFAYAALTGVADGWLPFRFVDLADGWIAGALATMDEDGLIHEVCGAPHFDRPGISAEAQAFAIMALTARARVCAQSGT